LHEDKLIFEGESFVYGPRIFYVGKGAAACTTLAGGPAIPQSSGGTAWPGYRYGG
jgi:hypothetical protein